MQNSKEEQVEIKKAFHSDQRTEIEENNRMGKTSDLFKKIRIPREISCKVGLNKGQKWYGPNRSRRYFLKKGDKSTKKNHTEKVFMTQITVVM